VFAAAEWCGTGGRAGGRARTIHRAHPHSTLPVAVRPRCPRPQEASLAHCRLRMRLTHQCLARDCGHGGARPTHRTGCVPRTAPTAAGIARGTRRRSGCTVCSASTRRTPSLPCARPTRGSPLWPTRSARRPQRPHSPSGSDRPESCMLAGHGLLACTAARCR
jgi:hypothetical protein